MNQTDGAGPTLAFTLQEADDGSPSPRRLDLALAPHFPKLSRSELKRRLLHLEVNGKIAKISEAVKPGDRISATLTAPPPADPAKEEPLPEVPIVFEDEALLVLHKPAGILVHPAPGVSGQSLLDVLRPRFPDPSRFRDPARPGIVHRLDKETTGLLVVAKIPRVERRLLAAFKQRRITKQYEALVKGRIWQAEGLVDAPIGPDPAHALRHRIKPHGELDDAKEAQTGYRVLKRFPDFTHLELDLHTGRTHQIRVHMASLGHPVLGDRKYDRNPGREEHLFLMAVHLAFTHPDSGEELDFHLELPLWFRERLQALEKAQSN